MNNETNKLIPELRFPEFFETDEWKVEELGDISEIVRGGSPRPIQDYQTKDVDGLNWLKIADVSSESKYITETKEKVIKEALSSTREVNPGDLILSNSMSFGRPYILKITTCIHDGWIAIRKISPNTFENYLYYLISSESSQNYFQINAAGAAVKNLNAEIIKLLPITFPNLTEQQKIASCLSSLDELITAHTNKLETLKNHKKGLMQNLFPQEGEKVPKLRFKEFEKDGEWENKTLGDCLLKSPEYGINACTVPFSEKLPKYLRITDISEDGRLLLNNKVSVSKDVTENNYLNDGDIVLARTGASVGKSYKYRIEDGRLVFAGFLIRVKPNKEKLVSDFLFQFLSTNQYWKWVSFVSARSGQPGINGTEYSSMPINLPPKLKEQQKIAETLSSLDHLIKEQSNKIEQLKSHKKGLMQGLFPKVNN